VSTSVVFDLIGTLVTQLGAELEANVYDAFGEVTEDPGDYLVIGFEDPNDDQATSAEGQQEWAGLGARARNEEGTVTCFALSWNGDADMSAARTAVKAITDAVESHLRADPNLGGDVPGLLWTGYGTRTRVIQIPATDGACVMCVFDVAFKARI
jgi:hypothetical protein